MLSRHRARALLLVVAVPLALVVGAAQRAEGAGTTPDQVGQWSAPLSWPNVAVHVMLEPNGKILSIDAWDDAPNKEYVWDPVGGTFTLAAYARNLFCAGHTQLGNGKTLIVGGNTSANNGIKDTTIFDSTNNSWTRGPDMSVGRWYPTATELPDGRVFVFSGDAIDATGPSVPHAFKSSSVSSLPSVYDPVANAWQDLPAARLTTPLYPFLFTLTDGRIIDVGPDTVTRTIKPGVWTWQTVATSSFDGGSAVMYRPDKILKSGNYTDPDFTGADLFTTGKQTAVLDMTQPSPTWRDTAPMAFGRGYHVLTMLPDGKVLVTGGEAASDGRDLTKAVLPAEMWDPATEQWTTMAAQVNGRLYHSTALLLPDGRVLVAGGGQAPGGGSTNQLNGEIYSPPYLFKGPRPTITSAPATFDWSGSFTVSTPNAAQIASVALIKTGAMTHAINMSQRYVPLSFTAGTNSLTVQAPANANMAPPGYYMLWIVDTNGVPSVSWMTKTSGATDTDTQAPTAPTSPNVTSGAGFANLTWTASTDNVGVVRYNVHRSTTAGFTPSAANRVGQPIGTTFSDTGLAAGTYFYKVTAEDAAGNLSPASTEVSATVTADTQPPTVSITAPANGATVATTATVSANASDNGTVAGVQFKLDGSSLSAEDTTSPYSISWDTTNATNGPHTLTAVARDLAGNVTTSAAVSVTVTNAGGTDGLVAAYGFDEGIGTTTADQSGHGNTGTLSNATWAGGTAGKFGNALSFNGTNAFVSVADSASLDLTNAMTVEAWVKPTSLGSWNTVVFKERPSYYAYALYANTGTNRPSANVFTSVDNDTRGTAQLPLNAWSHLAMTYDGNMLTLYVNGVQAAQLLAPGAGVTSANPLKIGGNAIWGEYFSGLIDEVHIYNRTLTLAQVNADMTRPVTNPDTSPPTAPGTLTGTGALTTAQLNWTPATDDVGVTKYDVYRGTTAGFTPTTANRIAQPTGTSYTDNVAAGSYFYKVAAEDAAGNIGPTTNEVAVTVGDTVAPGAPGTLAVAGGVGKATLTWGAATDNVGVVRYDVYRGTSTGFTPSTANRIGQPAGTSLVDTVAPGTYFYRVAAEDAAGNIGPVSNEGSGSVTADTTAPSAPAGLAGTVAGATVNLSWTASTDDVGVVRYNVHRGTSSGFTPSAANRIGQPTTTSFSDTGLAIGTYYYKVTAEDAAGNVGAESNQATATVADATPPSAPGTVTAGVAGSTVNLSWTAATDNVGVLRYNVHRGTVSDVHTLDREQTRPAGRHQLLRHVGPAGELLLQGHSRGRGRQRRRRLEHRLGHRRRHDGADDAWLVRCDRRRGPGDAQLDGLDRQRRRPPLQRPPRDHLRLHADRRRTGSRSRPERATPTRASRPAPTTTRSPPRTPPATSAPPPPRAAPRSQRRRRSGSSPPTASTRAQERRPPTSPGPATSARSPTRPGPAPATASSATRSPSTAATALVSAANSASLEPDDGHDPGGVGEADLALELEHRRLQGAHGLLRLGALRQHRHQPTLREQLHERRQRHPRHGAGGRERLDAPHGDLRRSGARPLRQRHAGRDPARQRRHEQRHRLAAHRRQHDLGRVLQRPDRRGSRLQPRPLCRRDRHGHEQGGHVAGRQPADCAGNALWQRHSDDARSSPGARRPTTWASSATTSIAVRRPASRRRRRTGSRSRRGRATPTTSPRAPTSTRSPRRTRPGTSGRRRTRSRSRSATRSRRARPGRWRSPAASARRR